MLATSVLTSLDDNTTRNESSMRAVSGLAIIPSWNLSASFLTRSLYRWSKHRCSNRRISISLADSNILMLYVHNQWIVVKIVENSVTMVRISFIILTCKMYSNRTLKLSFERFGILELAMFPFFAVRCLSSLSRKWILISTCTNSNIFIYDGNLVILFDVNSNPA